MIAEQEVLYGSRSPSKAQSARKAPRTPNGSAANRRGTFGGSVLKPDSKATQSSSTRKTDKVNQIEQTNNLDDAISCFSSGSFLYTLLPFCFSVCLHLRLADFSPGKGLTVDKGIVLDVVGYPSADPAKKNVNVFFLSPPIA